MLKHVESRITHHASRDTIILMNNTSSKPYLLFDAGGTLVFPDHSLLVQIASQSGVQTTSKELFAIHCEQVYAADHHTRQRGHLVTAWPEGYTRTLFKGLGINNGNLNSIVKTADEHDRRQNLWTSTVPWMAQTLAQLTLLGYRMAVISNADGRAEQILIDLNLRSYFERVFDSHILRVSKPNKAIFEIALNELNLRPAEAIYIGDVFFLDVWGANQAKIGGIHLDPLGLYAGWPGVHIPTVQNLSDLLSQYAANTDCFYLCAMKEFPLSFENKLLA